MDNPSKPSPSMAEITMASYLLDMHDELAQAAADGLVEITPNSDPH
ncbi:hypothetical protein [Brevibacterium sp.]|nr:hypothetical protein [Brevibacterium sp.]